MTKKKVVVVIPCYNEGEALGYTIEALAKIHKKLKSRYLLDVMFVNDGSIDVTQEVIEKAAEKYDFIFYREFAHNAGHQSALRAGLNATTDYDATIMMDADMQHPPELIPGMIRAWEGGMQVVQMTRDDSADDVGTIRYWASVVYYELINWVSGLKLEYGASDFRLIDKAVTKTVAKSPESGLFLRGYFSWLNTRRTTISYRPNKRVAGVSKYSLKKLLDLAYKGVLQFSEKPLRIAMSLGAFLALAALLYGLTILGLYLCGVRVAVSGWTSLMVGLLFCFGINFILLGIIGSYLAHSIGIQKQRPEFIIASEKLSKS